MSLFDCHCTQNKSSNYCQLENSDSEQRINSICFGRWFRPLNKQSTHKQTNTQQTGRWATRRVSVTASLRSGLDKTSMARTNVWMDWDWPLTKPISDSVCGFVPLNASDKQQNYSVVICVCFCLLMAMGLVEWFLWIIGTRIYYGDISRKHVCTAQLVKLAWVIADLLDVTELVTELKDRSSQTCKRNFPSGPIAN